MNGNDDSLRIFPKKFHAFLRIQKKQRNFPAGLARRKWWTSSTVHWVKPFHPNRGVPAEGEWLGKNWRGCHASKVLNTKTQTCQTYGWFTYMTGETWPHDQGEIYIYIYSHGVLQRIPAQPKTLVTISACLSHSKTCSWLSLTGHLQPNEIRLRSKEHVFLGPWRPPPPTNETPIALHVLPTSSHDRWKPWTVNIRGLPPLIKNKAKEEFEDNKHTISRNCRFNIMSFFNFFWDRINELGPREFGVCSANYFAMFFFSGSLCSWYILVGRWKLDHFRQVGVNINNILKPPPSKLYSIVQTSKTASHKTPWKNLLVANKNLWIWQTPSSNYKPQKTYWRWRLHLS